MNYQKTILNNGLRVITITVPRAASVTAMVIVGAGSRLESPRTSGISHFLEHMVFKGTQKLPSALAISSTIDGIGAEFNAATGKEETLFYIKSAKEHLPLAVEVLSDMVLAPKLDPEAIEREKGVIIEEINMYEDLPMRKVAEDFEKLLYPDSSLGWDIAGSRETISQITREDFLDYQEKLYFPQNMLLVVAGGANEAKTVRLAEKYLGAIKSNGERPKRVEKFPQKKPRLYLKTKRTDQTHLILGFRGNPLGHPDRYAEAVLAAILGGGMSSRLFIQVREKRGLGYYVRTEPEHYVDNGYVATSSGVDTRRVFDAIKVILEEYTKLTKAGEIPMKELKKAKEFVKGRMVLEIEDSRNVANFYGAQELLEGKIRTLSQIEKEINRVKTDDVARVASEFFTNRRLNLAVIGPFEDEEKFSKILRV
ncbi:MAG: pitrilysin family protein [bacterium]|nr:pitrilysin family protein [bacterium]